MTDTSYDYDARKERDAQLASEEQMTDQPKPLSVDIARRFHAAYERLAPQFGYETRQDTREFDPASPNGRLMIAVCGEVLATLERQLADWSMAGKIASDRLQELKRENAALREAGRTAGLALDGCIEELRPSAFVYDCGMMDDDNNYPVLDAIRRSEEAIDALRKAAGG